MVSLLGDQTATMQEVGAQVHVVRTAEQAEERSLGLDVGGRWLSNALGHSVEVEREHKFDGAEGRIVLMNQRRPRHDRVRWQ